MKFSSKFIKIAKMASKIQQIMELVPHDSVLLGSWLSDHGLNAQSQYAYMKSGWLTRITKGVYKMKGATPSLMAIISSYNTQLDKHCIVGAFTALQLRGYAHYLPMGKPKAYLFADRKNKLPSWIVNGDWDMSVRYMTTSFLGEGLLGVESMTIEQFDLLVSSPERAILECLYLPESASSLLDVYYIMEGLTTLRPKLVQTLLESCTSLKVKRLFLYMAEKANHPWYKTLDLARVSLGTSRLMISPTGKYISKYNMTIPKELAEYE